jgi:hypothetical protein
VRGLLHERGSGLRYRHFLRVNGVKGERLRTGKLVFPEYKKERSVPRGLKLKSNMRGRYHLNHAKANVCVWWIGGWGERGESINPAVMILILFAFVFKSIILSLQFLVFL